MNDVKRIREGYNLTRQELSALTGIPVRTLQNWELGVRECPIYLPPLLLAYLYVNT